MVIVTTFLIKSRFTQLNACSSSLNLRSLWFWLTCMYNLAILLPTFKWNNRSILIHSPTPGHLAGARSTAWGVCIQRASQGWIIWQCISVRWLIRLLCSTCSSHWDNHTFINHSLWISHHLMLTSLLEVAFPLL